MTISTIVLEITGVFKGSSGTLGFISAPKDEGGVLKKWLDRLKRLAGKAIEALPVIVVSVVGAILIFLRQGRGFVTEHTCALIVGKSY